MKLLLLSMLWMLSTSVFSEVAMKSPQYRPDENHPPVTIPSMKKQAQEESPEDIRDRQLTDEGTYPEDEQTEETGDEERED